MSPRARIRFRPLVLTLCSCLAVMPAGRAAPVFHDVTATAGLGGVKASWSAAWGDFDGDGWLDLVTVGHVKNLIHVESRLLHNVRGKFSDVTQSGLFGARRFGTANCTHAAAFCDLDGDGRLDLLLSQEITKDYHEPAVLRSNEVWLQQAGGGFADIAAQAGLAGNWLSRGFYAWDFNRDGRLDLLLQASDQGRPEGNFMQLFRREGPQRFRDIASGAGLRLEGLEQRHKAAVLADFNGDGWPDIFSLHPAYLLLNNGDETFRDATAASGIIRLPRQARWHKGGAAAEDFDGDGDLDLVVAEGNEPGGNRLYRNDGQGRFADVTAAAGILCGHRSYAATWGDYDNDGWPDLYFGNLDQAEGRKGPNTLFRNNGDGTFRDVTAEAGAGAVTEGGACDVMFVDYDNDGSLDLFVTNGESNRIGLVVLLRNTGNDNHWLKLRLAGVGGNTHGLGAKVAVRAGGRTQTREHTGPIHFMSQDSQPLHFGLGRSRVAETVEITWPGGRRQVLHDVSADRMLSVREETEP